MISPSRSALAVARESLLDLEAARRALSQLESLLFSASVSTDHPAHANNLIQVAWDLAADAANTADCKCEDMRRSLDCLAPENGESQNVARLPVEVSS